MNDRVLALISRFRRLLFVQISMAALILWVNFDEAPRLQDLVAESQQLAIEHLRITDGKIYEYAPHHRLTAYPWLFKIDHTTTVGEISRALKPQLTPFSQTVLQQCVQNTSEIERVLDWQIEQDERFQELYAGKQLVDGIAILFQSEFWQCMKQTQKRFFDSVETQVSLSVLRGTHGSFMLLSDGIGDHFQEAVTEALMAPQRSEFPGQRFVYSPEPSESRFSRFYSWEMTPEFALHFPCEMVAQEDTPPICETEYVAVYDLLGRRYLSELHSQQPPAFSTEVLGPLSSYLPQHETGDLMPLFPLELKLLGDVSPYLDSHISGRVEPTEDELTSINDLFDQRVEAMKRIERFINDNDLKDSFSLAHADATAQEMISINALQVSMPRALAALVLPALLLFVTLQLINAAGVISEITHKSHDLDIGSDWTWLHRKPVAVSISFLSMIGPVVLLTWAAVRQQHGIAWAIAGTFAALQVWLAASLLRIVPGDDHKRTQPSNDEVTDASGKNY